MSTNANANLAGSANAPAAFKVPDVVIDVLLKQVAPALVEAVMQALLRLFARTPKTIPEPSPVAPAPPVPNTPAPVPILPVPAVPALAYARLSIDKAEKPDMTVTPRRHDPGNLYADPMGMIARDEAFHYGSSFWANATLFAATGDPIEDQELVAADLEFDGEHLIYRGDELVAYIKGAGDTNPVGGGAPAPYHTWSIDGIRIADRSWRQSAGLNPRFTIEIEGTFTLVYRIRGIEANRITLRTS